jgi:dCMP deaminase
MPCQHEMDAMYLDIASRIALMSKAVRKKVGAVLVKDNNIISFGWNGMPSGFDNCCEDNDNNTKSEVIHAEFNVISKIARSNLSSNASTIYLTLSPCFECSKLIIQSNIIRVVYKEKYRDDRPISFLKTAGILVEEMN